MAIFCPVAPPTVLHALQSRGELGRSHLVLAHDIIKPQNRELYRRIFNGAWANEFTNVILDNSVIELQNAVALDVIEQAAEIVRPTVIVLPDVMLDCNKTIRATYEALPIWRTRLKPYFRGAEQFMVVPQGMTLHAFTVCCEELADLPDVTWWGIPRNLIKYLGTRRDAIAIAFAMNRNRNIHMLGFSDDMIDDLICARSDIVNTIDSAVPLRVPYPFKVTMRTEPRGTWWETASYSGHMYENLKIARKLFNGGGYHR